MAVIAVSHAQDREWTVSRFNALFRLFDVSTLVLQVVNVERAQPELSIENALQDSVLRLARHCLLSDPLAKILLADQQGTCTRAWSQTGLQYLIHIIITEIHLYCCHPESPYSSAELQAMPLDDDLICDKAMQRFCEYVKSMGAEVLGDLEGIQLTQVDSLGLQSSRGTQFINIRKRQHFRIEDYQAMKRTLSNIGEWLWASQNFSEDPIFKLFRQHRDHEAAADDCTGVYPAGSLLGLTAFHLSDDKAAFEALAGVLLRHKPTTAMKLAQSMLQTELAVYRSHPQSPWFGQCDAALSKSEDRLATVDIFRENTLCEEQPWYMFYHQ